MPKIVFLNGPPDSGKDTACRIAAWRRASFADELKSMVRDAFGWAEDPPKDVPLCEWDSTLSTDCTYRQLLIAFSEEYIKPRFGKDFFGRKLLQEIKYWKDPVIGITDSGFAEEALVITRYFGKTNCCILQLHAEGCDFKGDSRGYLTHEDIGAAFFLPIINLKKEEAQLKRELGGITLWLRTK